MADQEQLKRLRDQSVSEWNRWRRQHPEILPDLRNADLSDQDLSHANLRHANLTGVNLQETLLCCADLSHADLTLADLTNANLSHANLGSAIFRKTIFNTTNCKDIKIQNTLFVDVDLSKVNKLEKAQHLGPSTIDITTIYRSRGSIPEMFLRGTGIPEIFLDFAREQGKKPFNYFTCFISYAHEDQSFVETLRNDLQAKGVRCWIDSVNLQPGDRFPAEIEEAIRFYDKLLVVFSTHSLKSDWVKREVELARQKERQANGKNGVLFPICLDNVVLNQPGWAESIGKGRHIADFSSEKPDVYQKNLNKLLSALERPATVK